MQEEGFEPTQHKATNLQSVPAHHLRRSCDATLRGVSSLVGLIRQAFVFTRTALGLRLAIDEHLCSVVFVAVFSHEVVFHDFLLTIR